MTIKTVTYAKNRIRLIDQRLLPQKLKYLYCRNLPSVWKAIRAMAVRGAPAIGVTAAYGVVLGMKSYRGKTKASFSRQLDRVCDYLASSRPTAVNLFNALDRMQNAVKEKKDISVSQCQMLLKKEADAILREDCAMNRRMGDHGARLIKNNMRALTICNAGALATVDYGTALGVFYSAKSNKKKFKVYSCETRPRLQGARLTAWELLKSKIDVTLICDSMAATLMKQGLIDIIFTGADRVALNGDAANKIGTYSLAVAARYHKIPFYVVTPLSTFDQKLKTGKQIPIEQRDEREVTTVLGQRIAPQGIKVTNPAFDVTDYKLITALVTEYGLIKPPYKRNIENAINRYRKERR